MVAFILGVVLALGVLIPVFGGYQNEFESYQETLNVDEIFYKISKYLKKGTSLDDHFLLTEKAFFVFATKLDKENCHPEFVLKFGSKSKPYLHKFFLKNNSSKPLQGLKIAIDPGHLGGDMAEIEDRVIDIALPDKTRIQFNEGTLATFTAKILRQYLVHAGADVLMTRNEPGQAVAAISFSEWCAENFKIKKESDWTNSEIQKNIIDHLKKFMPSFTLCKNEDPEGRLKSIIDARQKSERVLALKKALFRLCYNMIDLRARIEKINSFNPDLTIVIHFNANGGAHDICSSNYNLTFIPGSFLNGELNNQQAREEFIRLLVTNDLEESLKLSKFIIDNIKNKLSITTMKSKSYMPDNTIFADDGIYCRNLALTRGVHGPICYGETLIQNNIEEAKRLAQKNFDFDGTLISYRLDQIAQAYFYGICQYLGLNLNMLNFEKS